LGEIAGMVIGAALGWNDLSQMILAIALGFIGGFVLGMWPLLKARFSFKRAFKQVLIAEGLSIVVMETAEVLIQLYTPGVMHATITDSIFWIGMLLALIAGFIAAYPINYFMIKRGYRHNH
jgi:putative flippase GtrA